ncbi:MAG: NADH-quinone oxidoreductase subunit N [Deltaproteobacteria bacterium]|nr:NADH-quinone oxidoreductase subunit N [Deltaproteobacteria bacterium]
MNWFQFLGLTLPWLIVLGASLTVLFLGTLMKRGAHAVSMAISLLSLVAALFLSWQHWVADVTVSMGMMSFGRMTFLGWMVIAIASIFTVLLSHDYLARRKLGHPEYYSLILLSTVGMASLIAGSHLMLIFLGIEVMSIAVYALAGFLRHRLSGNEAALKYFLTGAFASAFLLLGIAFIFGTTKTMDLTVLAEQLPTVLSGDMASWFLFGVAMVLIGFAFKIAAVPFHAWAPDAYDGAPTPITQFMATAVKAAAFFALLRVASPLVVAVGPGWAKTLWLLSAATMIIGNLAALMQDNLKRMLAYSSIAHAGYALVAFPTLSTQTPELVHGVIFYLIAYTFMTAGSFAIVAFAQGQGESADVSHVAGLAKRHPWMAASFTIFLLSLTGFPPTLGFFGKYFLFSGAIKNGSIGLVVLALLSSAVSAYYYLRPIVVMYFHESREGVLERTSPATSLVAVVTIAFLAILYFGIFPSDLLAIVQRSGM